MVNQRSKSGCWTCRLRRKKCPEDGFPCSNCESRAVVCHGYGPRPAWKDRGLREKEEADRLQLQRRAQSHARRHSATSLFAASSQSPSATSVSATNFQSSSFPESSVAGPLIFPDTPDIHTEIPLLDTSTLLSEFWVPDFEALASTSTLCDNSVLAVEHPSPSKTAQEEQPITTPLLSPTTSVLDFSSTRVTPSEEREIELMLQFLGEDFATQHPSDELSGLKERFWLVCIFKRSSTFFYASLATSSYFNFLNAPAHDGKRTEFFREYDQYRESATKGHRALLEEANRENILQPPTDFTLGETIICSIQLAILEVSHVLNFCANCQVVEIVG